MPIYQRADSQSDGCGDDGDNADYDYRAEALALAAGVTFVTMAVEGQKPKNTPEWQTYGRRRYAAQFATQASQQTVLHALASAPAYERG